MVGIAIPLPRPAPEQPQPAPLQLPWSCAPISCSAVIGDTLLLKYALPQEDARHTTGRTVWQARKTLTAWAADQDAVAARRDVVVRAAVAAGLSKSEVHRLTGIARTTIGRITSPALDAERGCAT